MKVFFAVLAALFVFGATGGGDEPPAPTSQAVLAASFESEVVPVTEIEGRPITTVHSEPVPVTAPAPGAPEPVPAPAAPAPAPIGDPNEDEPGWDCATMGNKICGSTYTEAVILPDLLYPVTPAPAPTRDPYEDEPGWDCTIHGNKICGGNEVAAPAPAVIPATPAPAFDAPMEDEPGWDCRTMGNKICGSDLTTITGH